MDRNPWAPFELIREGKSEQALGELLAVYPAEASSSQIMTLGVAYLLSERYRDAWSHFEHAIDREPKSISSYYKLAGASRWCLNDRPGAVECWKSGLESRYGDAAGASVGLPLLLFAASILNGAAVSEEESIALLKQKADDPRIDSWPGPLVLLCLGRQEIDLNLEGNENWAGSRRRVTGFYKSLLEYRQKELSRESLRERMKQLADTSGPEWTNPRAFTSLIWNAEYFVARYEASRL